MPKNARTLRISSKRELPPRRCSGSNKVSRETLVRVRSPVSARVGNDLVPNLSMAISAPP